MFIYFVFVIVVFFKLIAVFSKSNIFNFEVFKNMFFVVNVFAASFIFFDFFKVWFFDINVFYHIIKNCNIFIFFTFIINRIINNINNNLKTKKYNFVQLLYKKNCLFIIHNVFYVKNYFYNNDCHLTIIKNNFFININDI